MAGVKTIHEIIEEVSPYYKKKGEAEAVHTLSYESSTETLEPVYFFVLDLMEDFGLSPEKLVDNFSSSPGSGHFSELQGKATAMQQQGSKILGDVNTVLRSVLNIIYDLKDFYMRLQAYDDLNSKDKNKSAAARLSLKQLWMDKVDYTSKGNSSIKAMALGQAGMQTLMDAFLAVEDESLNGPDGKEIDLNERIKRIVKSRIIEFNYWIKQSEKELRKRFELEKNYLRSQVNALKLYSRWARPYLLAASRLESKDHGKNPHLVNVFNTIMLELTLLGKTSAKIKEAALEGSLPKEFTSEKFLKNLEKNGRTYYSVLLVDFKFRGIPQRVAQQSHFAFGGRAEITFRGYALNDDELAKLYEELDKSDLESVLGLVEGVSGDSLKQMQEEIDFFLEGMKPEEEKIEKKSADTSNPFLALVGYYDKEKKTEKKKDDTEEKKEIVVKKDNWIESEHLRPLAIGAVAGEEGLAFKLFTIYKKAHGMASYL